MTDEKMLKIFGYNVKKQREKINMSIKELSNKTKIREKYLIKIEEGNAKGITASKAFMLIEALNSNAEELFKGL